jgi:choline-glycine betaine transporter
MVLTAILTMIISVTLQHLGLMEAIAKIITKISQCYMCTTFWLTLAVMVLCKYDILLCVLLSALNAYISNYVMFLFELLQILYNFIDKWVRKLKAKVYHLLK